MRGLFIGSGSISRIHRDVFLDLEPEAQVSVVARTRPDWVRAGERHCESLDVALREKPDVAVVANPCPLHFETTKRLVREGVPVLLEKPIGSDEQEADGFVEFVAQSGVPVVVGYDLRSHPAALKMLEMSEAGTLGKLLNLTFEVGQDLREWRPHMDYRESVSARKALGGGVLLELSHEIDLALCFMKTVEGVAGRAHRASDLEIDVEDTAHLLVWNGESTASIQLDFIQRPVRQYWRVVGTKGSVAWENDDSHVLHTDFQSGETREISLPNMGVARFAYRRQMQLLLEQAKAGQPDYAGLRQAARVLEIIRSVRSSAT